MDKTQGSVSLIDDRTTVATLRTLVFNPKPPGLAPVDILQLVALLLRKAEDHCVYDSQQTLAQACACDPKTIVRSQRRLEKLGWLARPSRKGRTNELRLNHEKLPASEPLRLKISEDAGKLALWYQTAVTQLTQRQKFPKHWFAQQKPSAQRILDRLGGDLEKARRYVWFALTHPRHRRRSAKSLYDLLGRWSKLSALYEAAHQQTQQIAEHQQSIDAIAGGGDIV